MCLLAFDWDPQRRPFPFIFVGNRDEYFERPSQGAHFWKEYGQNNGGNNDGSDDKNDDNSIDIKIYGGRDLRQGGSWLTCSTNGRFATLTNFHKLEDRSKTFERSRGELVVNFCLNRYIVKTTRTTTTTTTTMTTEATPNETTNDKGTKRNEKETTTEAATTTTISDYVRQYIKPTSHLYGGYSLLLYDGKSQSIIFCSNRGGNDENEFIQFTLQPGLYGLSNHLLDTSWPKLIRAKLVLKDAICNGKVNVSSSTTNERKNETATSSDNAKSVKDDDDVDAIEQTLCTMLLDGMKNEQRVNDQSLLPTTLGEEEEYYRSSVFVRGPTYGTRTTSTVLYHPTKGYYFTEQNHTIKPFSTKTEIAPTKEIILNATKLQYVDDERPRKIIVPLASTN